MTNKEKLRYFVNRAGNKYVSAECSSCAPSMLNLPTNEPLDSDTGAPIYNGFSIEDLESVADLRGKPQKIKLAATSDDRLKADAAATLKHAKNATRTRVATTSIFSDNENDY